MPPDTLEFEEPIALLLKEVEALSMLPVTTERQRSLDSLNMRIDSLRGEIYKNLTPWQRVMVARHPNRPTVLDYATRLFTEFTEISGDRRFADDHAIVAGFANYRDEPVLIVGHHKGGGDTKQKIYRNFGYAKPEGYRKALRAMKLAEKFRRPVIRVHRHTGRVPGHRVRRARHFRGDRTEPSRDGSARHANHRRRSWGRRQRGRAGPCGWRSHSDARVRHLQRDPPEGCAAILWRDSGRKVEAAEALKLTAGDLLRLKLVDEIVPEPRGGAHTNHELAATLLDTALGRALASVSAMDSEPRLQARYEKWRAMGNVGIAES
jgi:acetyl-CoA carboxylase carboxyl transferase subunit alpha